MANRICLDAGHYGKYNQSPANRSYYESEVMWKLHLLLKKFLEEYGFVVVTTRENIENDLELTARGRKSNACDLFLSLHSNAVGSGVNEEVDYAVVYHLTDDNTTKCDDISKEIAYILAPVIAEVMGTKQSWAVKQRLSDNDRNYDGIFNDNYYGVLHGARTVGTAGLILEHSFHTNTRATNWLLDDNNLERLAKAEAEAIAKYFGMTKKEDTPVQPAPEVKKCYRVRKAWDDEKSQLGAYEVLENAKNDCPEGYTVYDWNGKAVYTKGVVKVKMETLKKGSTGNQVTIFETLMKELGYYTGSIDTEFGSKCVAAVNELMKDYPECGTNGEPDNVCGSKCWNKIFSLFTA